MSDETKLDTRKLNDILKTLKSDKRFVKVGVLANHTHRYTPGPNSATIGAFQEFGTSKIPSRSFLLMPLVLYLNKSLKKAKSFDQDGLKQLIQTKNLQAWLESLGHVAVDIVKGAFDTSGYGAWQPDKNGGLPLVETGQLRSSISSEVANA